MTNEYHKDIDITKGIAMILVVGGHLIGGEGIGEYPTYSAVRMLLYKFHLPIFFFFAGATFCISYNRSERNVRYFANKVTRIGIPFIVFSILIFTGKFIAQQLSLYVSNQVDGFTDLFTIYLYPNESIAEYLWFIYVLLMLYLTMPILIRLLTNKFYFFIPILIIILLPDTNFLALSKYKQYIIYFALGYFVYKYYQTYTRYLDKYGMVFVSLFITAIIFSDRLYAPVIAGTAILAVHYIARLPFIMNMDILLLIGKNSFSLYLMHMPFIGLTTAVIISIIGSTNLNALHFSIIFLCGLFMPLILKLTVINKQPTLSKIFG